MDGRGLSFREAVAVARAIEGAACRPRSSAAGRGNDVTIGGQELGPAAARPAKRTELRFPESHVAKVVILAADCLSRGGRPTVHAVAFGNA